MSESELLDVSAPASDGTAHATQAGGTNKIAAAQLQD